MKHLILFESLNDNKADLEYASSVYPEMLKLDLDYIASSDEETDIAIKKVIEDANTFYRGKSDRGHVETVPPPDINNVSLDGAEILTDNGKYGLIFVTTSESDASQYGSLFKVRKILDFSGSRRDWIDNNKLNAYDCTGMETEEQYNEFVKYLESDVHVIFKVFREVENAWHYAFRGIPGEKLLQIVD